LVHFAFDTTSFSGSFVYGHTFTASNFGRFCLPLFFHWLLRFLTHCCLPKFYLSVSRSWFSSRSARSAHIPVTFLVCVWFVQLAAFAYQFSHGCVWFYCVATTTVRSLPVVPDPLPTRSHHCTHTALLSVLYVHVGFSLHWLVLTFVLSRSVFAVHLTRSTFTLRFTLVWFLSVRAVGFTVSRGPGHTRFTCGYTGTTRFTRTRALTRLCGLRAHNARSFSCGCLLPFVHIKRTHKTRSRHAYAFCAPVLDCGLHFRFTRLLWFSIHCTFYGCLAYARLRFVTPGSRTRTHTLFWLLVTSFARLRAFATRHWIGCTRFIVLRTTVAIRLHVFGHVTVYRWLRSAVWFVLPVGFIFASFLHG